MKIKDVVETKINSVSVETNNHVHSIIIRSVGDAYLAHLAVCEMREYINNLFDKEIINVAKNGKSDL